MVQGDAQRSIPRRLPHRLSFFEWLWDAIEHDVTATVDELRANGWPEAAIPEAMDDYRRWIEGNLADAVLLGRVSGGVAA